MPHGKRNVCSVLALASLLILMILPSQSQVNAKLGGGVGVVVPSSDLGGSTIEYYNGTSYGLASGLNVHAKGKFGLSGLNLVGEIGYSSLGNSGDSEPGQGKVEITHKIVSLKLGPEFRISLPAFPVTPHMGAHFALNSISGETVFQGVAKVPSATYDVKTATRYGVGFSVGAEVGLGPLLWLDFTLSYDLMNISGKEWDANTPGAGERIGSYLSLNDSPDPLYIAGDDKHFISQKRDIHSILLTTSLLFGL